MKGFLKMKYFPIEVQKSIFDINFTRLYANGKKIILCALDNTLIPYSESMPSKELIEWAEKVKTIGFKLYLFSNNKDTRVLPFSLVLGADGHLASAYKPFIRRTKQFLKKIDATLAEVVVIGDQFVTDITVAKKIGVDSIIVKTIDHKTQKWYTKVNRLREKWYLKRLKKARPDLYRLLIEKEIIHE